MVTYQKTQVGCKLFQTGCKKLAQLLTTGKGAGCMGTREMTKRYRLTQWAKAFQERAERDETIIEFCSRKGITKDKYYYWLRRVRLAAGEQMPEERYEQQTAIALRSFTEVKVVEPVEESSVYNGNQICIETGTCKITAGNGYPIEALVKVLRETINP